MNGVQRGKGTHYYKNEDVFKGVWVDGKKEGKVHAYCCCCELLDAALVLFWIRFVLSDSDVLACVVLQGIFTSRSRSVEEEWVGGVLMRRKDIKYAPVRLMKTLKEDSDIKVCVVLIAF